MASTSEDENVVQGRRTRSARKVTTPVVPVTRATRRTNKKLQSAFEEVQENEQVLEPIVDSEPVPVIPTEPINECVVGEENGVNPEVDETTDCQVEENEEVIEDLENVSGEVENNTEEIENINEHDEKSSSFPFGDVPSEVTSTLFEQSSADKEDNSFFANLAAEENANSLPSATDDTREDSGQGVENDVVEMPVVNEPVKEISEDMEVSENAEDEAAILADGIVVDEINDNSSDDNAIMEDLPNGANTDVTELDPDTEMVSEDELPMATKPKVQGTEEVSDEELPGPKLAELPADTEVVSEDELPSSTKKLATKRKIEDYEPKSAELPADTEVVSEDELPSSTKKDETKRKDEDSKMAELPADTEIVSEDELPSSNKKDTIKRKAEDYDPNSPTETAELPEKKAKTEEATVAPEPEIEKKKKLPELDKYWKAVNDDPADFTGWTYLLQYVDQENDVDAARDAYDAFLAHYPYCYGYWRKYADYEKRKGNKKKCEEVFERGLKAIPLSVDLWIHYLSHVKTNHGDDEAFIRMQFERAIDACGLEFRSDKLWEAYIKWESDRKRWLKVVNIYDRLLATPTQGYNSHFDSFSEIVNVHPVPALISVEEIKRLRDEVRESLGPKEKPIKQEKIVTAAKEEKIIEKATEKIAEKATEKIAEKATEKIVEKATEKDVEKATEKIDEKATEKIAEEVPKEEIAEKPHQEDVTKEKDTINAKSEEESKADEKPQVETEDVKMETESEEVKKEIISEESKEEIKKEAEEKVVVPETVSETVSEPEPVPEPEPEPEADDHLKDDEVSAVKDKILSIRRKVHKQTVNAVSERWTFEEGIKRPYFHVKPLERCQLKNWKEYLDFEIEKGDRKRIIVLFERCLIACALYDEFWLKLIRYLESQNDSILETTTRNAFERACTVHHPDKPSLHLMWSAFEELHNNFDKAAEILTNIEKTCPNLLQIAYRRINVERRRMDFDKCTQFYEHYINHAKNKNVASSLAIKYARFMHKIKGDIEEGLKILKVALEKDSSNARLVLQMIDLALQRPVVDENEVVSIMDTFMAREGMEPDQKVLFAQRKVEFLEDFGSTTKGLQDAQRLLQVALSKANEAKKKQSETTTTVTTAPPPTKKTSKESNPPLPQQTGGSAANYSNSYPYGSNQSSNYYYGNNQPGYQSYCDYGSNSWGQYAQGGGYQWNNFGNYY